METNTHEIEKLYSFKDMKLHCDIVILHLLTLLIIICVGYSFYFILF